MRHLDKKTGKGWLDISLDELWLRFGLLPSEYALMSDFKKRVLDYAIREINTNTDLTATYTQKNEVVKLLVLTLILNKNSIPNPKKTKENDSRDLNTFDMLAPIKMTDKQRNTFASKLAHEPELVKYAQGDLKHYGRLTE